MRYIICLVMACTMLGCGTSRIATRVGSGIGKSYTESAMTGTSSAEQSIKAWPYISGLIRGVLAGNYDLDVPTSAKCIIDTLDALAEKEELTVQDKGIIIGSFCRLEETAIREGWDRYGASITAAIRGALL